ncbi:hypothetical protein EYF80_030187 [Liparis tanakae]|uniref:Secreted protein n=1 Tax=Liparis tanakae TaxID=230148 RepID=A0A4Z2H2S8_9TELE|nr:hypothetical protein EYF80_030187 [Liparis tanakae]
MVPCCSPLLLIILMPAFWNMRFISSGVAVVAKSTSSGCVPDSRSRTAPPAILSSCWCFSNTSGGDKRTFSEEVCDRCTWLAAVRDSDGCRCPVMDVLSPASPFSPSEITDWNSLVFSFIVKRLLQHRDVLPITRGLSSLLHIYTHQQKRETTR